MSKHDHARGMYKDIDESLGVEINLNRLWEYYQIQLFRRHLIRF